MTGSSQNLGATTAEFAGETGSAAPAAEAAPAPAKAREWSNDHPVNIRLSLPLPIGRFYVTIVAGRERRSTERLAEERKKHPLVTAGNIAVLATLGTTVALAILFLMRTALFVAFAAG
jgi:hypothetical protein